MSIEKIEKSLIVVKPFNSYRRGDQIKNAEEIRSALKTHPRYVHKISRPSPKE